MSLVVQLQLASTLYRISVIDMLLGVPVQAELRCTWQLSSWCSCSFLQAAHDSNAAWLVGGSLQLCCSRAGSLGWGQTRGGMIAGSRRVTCVNDSTIFVSSICSAGCEVHITFDNVECSMWL